MYFPASSEATIVSGLIGARRTICPYRKFFERWLQGEKIAKVAV